MAGLAASALLAFAASAAGQVDLSVVFQNPVPATATVGTPVNYLVQAAGAGATNVWVTVVFSLGVQFNSGSSSPNCVANPDPAVPGIDLTTPGTTVRCPGTSGTITVKR